jgi:quercetin dioxygenase-like cupin family protein
MAEGRCIKVSPNEVEVYSPAGHRDTRNWRLIGPEAGSTHVELILGEMGPQGLAEAHAHESCDQIFYMLEGSLKVIYDGAEQILKPGDMGFIPERVPHQVVCMSEGARYLVMYAPPISD